MNTAGAERSCWERTAGWIARSPEETLRSQLVGVISTPALALLLVSTGLSVSLAETTIIDGSLTQWCGSLVVWISAFFLSFFLYYRLSSFLNRSMATTREWFAAAVLSAVPLHLLLPAALLCQGGSAGRLVLYAIIKAFVLWAVARRAVLSVATLNGWPAWGALLLVIAPLLIAGIGCVVLSVLGMVGVLFALAGAFR